MAAAQLEYDASGGRRGSREQIGLGERGFSVNNGRKYGEGELAAAMTALDVAGDQVELEPIERPRRRSDCENGMRPCPWVGCRHHLAVEVTDTGSLKVNSHLDLEALEATCSLDVAADGGHTLLDIGRLLNLTRERVRQLEQRGLRAAKAFAHLAGVREDAVPFVPDREPQARPTGRNQE